MSNRFNKSFSVDPHPQTQLDFHRHHYRTIQDTFNTDIILYMRHIPHKFTMFSLPFSLDEN